MHQHQQHQHDHNQNDHHHHEHPSIFQILLTPKRIFIIHDIVEGSFVTRFFMIIPGFMMVYQMYRQLSDMSFGAISSFMNLINQACENCHRFVKGFLGYIIPFASFCILTDRFIEEVFTGPESKLSKTDYPLWKEYMKFALIIIWLINVIVPSGDLTHNWTQEEVQKIQITRPELNTSRCLCFRCRVPRVARSVHCIICSKCISRHEKHDLLLNKCVGSRNILFYLLFRFTILCYLLLNFMIFYEGRSTKANPNKTTIFQGFLMTINLYLLTFNIKELFLQILLVCHNITSYEIQMYRRITYLWKDLSMEYFNPFSMGLFHNIRELFEPYLASKNEFESIELEDINDVESNELNLNKILEQRRGKYVDWSRAKFYSVMDIKWSPMYAICKKQLKEREEMMKNIQQQENSQSQNINQHYQQQQHNQHQHQGQQEQQKGIDYQQYLQQQMNPGMNKIRGNEKNQEEVSLLNQNDNDD